MRVFVTGASGHIGGALTADLLSAGHQVVGLARSDASAAKLAALGAEVRRGDLDDLDGLADAARDSDGVIHLAFRHDLAFTGEMDRATKINLTAIETLGDALAGTGKPLVIAGGTLMLAFAHLGRAGTEDDVLPSDGTRVDSENAAIALAERGVRASVVRLTPTVHSSLDTQGFIPMLIGTARRTGVSAYVGDGANRWPAVDTRDAARLFRLAVESAPAGTRLHAVADEGVAFRDIATSIGRYLDIRVTSLSAEEAAGHFGPLGGMVTLDNPSSSAKTRQLLGWEPTHAGLIDDIAQGHYFTES